MSARRRGREGLNIFDNTNLPSVEETAAHIFGELNIPADNLRQVANPVSIFEIYPDLTQPRRAIPTPVRQHWDGKPTSVVGLFAHWRRLVVEERGQDFDSMPYLLAQEEVTRAEKIGPVESALLDLLELAANIRRTGLTNPVTVAREGLNFRLETGERRWLSYHILYHDFPNERDQWEKIPARNVKEFSVWRQAGENNARANLNAISRARQLAILLIDLYVQQGVTFPAFHQLVALGECDRAFYAQMADGKRYPIPRGHGETVLNAMGLKQPSQVREYRDLLRLPDKVWQIADDLNWPQGRIRTLERSAAGDDNRLIALAVKQAVLEGYNTGVPTVEPPTPPRKVEENPLLSAEMKQIFARVRTVAKKVGQGKRSTQVDLYSIQMMRKWLDELEKAAREQLAKP